MKEKNRIKAKVYDEKFIFWALYTANSFILNPELLDEGEYKDLKGLLNPYDEELYERYTDRIKERLRELLEQDDCFKCKIYFKPKSWDEKKKKIEYRPIHTMSLVDQVASMCLVNIVMYDIDSDFTKPSNMSNMIPSNFYGNRLSYSVERVFKNWRKQYSKYTANVLNKTQMYKKNNKYKSRVKMDLIDFFPSVDPRCIYEMFCNYIPVDLSEEEVSIYKKIIEKLLFLRVTFHEQNSIRNYYGKDCETEYIKGIPQGLPYGYYMANLVMVEISKLYRKYLGDEIIYYVDDSVAFTNAVKTENELKSTIERINGELDVKISEILLQATNRVELNKFNDFYNGLNSRIKVHTDEKSYIESLSEIKSETDRLIYEQVSFVEIMGFNIENKEEKEDLVNRINSNIKYIEKEVKDGGGNESKVNLKILEQLKRFYKNREIKYSEKYRILDNQKEGADRVLGILRTLNSADSIIKALKNENLIPYIRLHFDKNQEIRDECDRIEETLLENNQIENLLFKQECSMERYTRNEDVYTEIEKKVKNIFSLDSNTYDKYNYEKKLSFEELEEKFKESQPKNSDYVVNKSDELLRRFLNVYYSQIIGINTNDRMKSFRVTSNGLTYNDVRVLAMFRNKSFSRDKFIEIYNNMDPNDNSEIDYSLLKVLDVFLNYVYDMKRVDELILLHKYTSDIWKNGSKYMYFYTLHNQEHAVELIRSVIKLTKKIYWLRIKKRGYFLLFAACYLHDISMVTYPDIDRFVEETKGANKIFTDFLLRINELDSFSDTEIKRILVDVYKDMESYYENEVRVKHPKISADEVRERRELDFLDEDVREKISIISKAHGEEVKDVYYKKSTGIKNAEILLRLADVLDITKYRISKVLLDHNIKNMSELSAFHWISHWLTNGYEIKYEPPKETGKEEKIIFVFSVVLDNTIRLNNSSPCKDKSMILDGEKMLIKCGESCDGSACNFVCKWFSKKNEYLFPELNALQEYVNELAGGSKISVEAKIKIENPMEVGIPSEMLNALRTIVLA